MGLAVTQSGIKLLNCTALSVIMYYLKKSTQLSELNDPSKIILIPLNVSLCSCMAFGLEEKRGFVL